MTSLLFLIPLSLLALALAIVLFFWAVKNGQYDNLDSAAMHMLLDDDQQPDTDDQHASAISTPSITP